LSDGEYLAPDQSDQPFSEAILPKCSRRYGFVPDVHGRNAPDGIYDMNTAAEGERKLELLIDAALMAMAASTSQSGKWRFKRSEIDLGQCGLI
jgi:hypothetical protein